MEENTKSQERSLWSIHKAESGQTYYYNIKTGESQWEKPECLIEPDEEEQDEWQQYQTDDGRSYWYNFKTKESKWQKPGEQLNKEDENSEEETPPDPAREFLQMLQEKEVPITMKWDQAVKTLSNDSRWNTIKIISEKKRLFNEYMGDLKKVERDEQKVRLSYAKEEFFKMLEDFKINSSEKKFWQVASALVNDPRWKAIPEEKERENLFQDHLDKLYEQERENTRHQRKTSTEDFKKKLQRYVESKMIDHTTTWDQCMKLFSQDRLLQIMMPVDALGVFEEVINPLYENWRNAIRQRYRNNRINFRDLLSNSLSDGMITHKTKWKDFVQKVKEHPLFLAMLGQTGSTPHEIFCDFMSTLRQNHQLYKSELKMVLKSKGVKTLEGVQFEQFNNLFQNNEAWNKMQEHEKKYYFRYFQENIKNKENQPSGPKRQKKMIKRFTKLLKSLSLSPGQKYEQVQQNIEESIATEFPKLQTLQEDIRRQIFQQFMDIEVQQSLAQESAKKKKKKKAKKQRKDEEERSLAEEENSVSEQANRKRKAVAQPETEPKIEKILKKDQPKPQEIPQPPPPPPPIQEEEDGEIPEIAENDVKDEQAMENEEEGQKKSASQSRKKRKSRDKQRKNKHSEDYTRRDKRDKSDKHQKKHKQKYN